MKRKSVDDVKQIRVVEYQGSLWSLDNQRLAAFNAAEIKEIPNTKVSLEDADIAKEFSRKINPIEGTGNKIVVTPNASGRKGAEKILRDHGKIK